MPCDRAELFSPEDLPVTEEDIRVLRQLRAFTPEEIFAGWRALAAAFPQLVEKAQKRPTFAGCRPFSLEDGEGEG